MKPRKNSVNLPLVIFSFVIVLIGSLLLFMLYFQHQKVKLLMDDFCIEANGLKMTEYRGGLIIYSYKFKCEGRGDTVFQSRFRDCNEDEWGRVNCYNLKPSKSVLKNLLR